MQIHYSSLFQANTTTYSAEDMCGPPATTVGYIDPGLLHYVVMNGYVALYIENNKDVQKFKQICVYCLYTTYCFVYLYHNQACV